jgi:hypothetical protein
VVGPLSTRIRYDGVSFVADDAGQNVGSLGFSTSNGVTVGYQSDVLTDQPYGAQVTQYGDGSLNPYIFYQDETLCRIKFKDDAGTIQTTEAATMDCILYVPGKFKKNNPAGKVYVNRGYCKVNANKVVSYMLDQNRSNIWFMGLMQV